jgi:hypothetical protein
MPRRKPSTHTPTPPGSAEPAPERAPATIHSNTVYTLPQARALLGLATHTLPRAIRRGELRVSRRGGRYFITGEWLLSWITSGPGAARHRRQAEGPDGGAAA